MSAHSWGPCSHSLHSHSHHAHWGSYYMHPPLSIIPPVTAQILYILRISSICNAVPVHPLPPSYPLHLWLSSRKKTQSYFQPSVFGEERDNEDHIGLVSEFLHTCPLLLFHLLNCPQPVWALGIYFYFCYDKCSGKGNYWKDMIFSPISSKTVALWMSVFRVLSKKQTQSRPTNMQFLGYFKWIVLAGSPGKWPK